MGFGGQLRTMGTMGTKDVGFCFLVRTIGTMVTMDFEIDLVVRTLGTMGTMDFGDIIVFPVLEAIYIFNFIFTQYPRGYVVMQMDNDIKVYPFAFMMSQTKKNVLLYKF
jgi:hypothetical protein